MDEELNRLRDLESRTRSLSDDADRLLILEYQALPVAVRKLLERVRELNND